MKKLMFSILLLYIGTSLQAQTFGASGMRVNGEYNPANVIYGQWLKYTNSRDVTMKFPQTPKGLNDAIKQVQQMLIKNELYITEPDVYKTRESSDISKESPQQMHESIQKGDSVVNLAWYSPDGSTLQLFLGKNSYEANVLNAYKLQ